MSPPWHLLSVGPHVRRPAPTRGNASERVFIAAYDFRLFERGDYLCHRETTLPEGARTSWHGATVVAAYFRKPPEENGPSPREHNPERASQRRPQSLRTTA